MTRASIVILVLLAFSSGLGSGFVLGRNRTPRSVDIASPDEILEAMVEEVGLSPEQKAECKKIRDKHHPRAAKLKQTIAPDLAAIRSEMRAEMSAIMDPAQRERFSKFYSRRDDQRATQEK